MDSVFQQPPFGGMNEIVPVAALKSPDCKTLLNFNLDQSGAKLRFGDSVFATVTTVNASASGSNPLIPYGNSKLFMPLKNNTSNVYDIWDVEAGTISYTTAALGVGNEPEAHLFFNKHLFVFFVGNYSPGYVYDGTNWGAIGYTGATTFTPFGGNVYNHRAFLIQYGEAAYWYSGVDLISGACTKVDLSSVVSEVCTLAAIASITISDNVTSVAYQAFIFSNGEILFYGPVSGTTSGGTYPNGNDWGLAGSARIGQIFSLNCGMSYQGDYLVFCDAGVVSLRDLFLKGSDDAQLLSVNSKIQKSWSELVQFARTATSTPSGPIFGLNNSAGNVRGIYDQKNGRIVILIPSTLYDSGGFVVGNTFFIFNTILQSWYMHQSYNSVALTPVISGTTQIRDIVFYKNKILMSAPGGTSSLYKVLQKEGAANFVDTSSAVSGYPFDMVLASVPYPKNAVYSITGIEPIIQSDLYAETDYTIIADFGSQVAGPQKTTGITTSIQKLMANVGITANFAQIRVNGTTVTGKTVGLALYGMNVWFDAGEKGSR